MKTGVTRLAIIAVRVDYYGKAEGESGLRYWFYYDVRTRERRSPYLYFHVPDTLKSLTLLAHTSICMVCVDRRSVSRHFTFGWDLPVNPWLRPAVVPIYEWYARQANIALRDMLGQEARRARPWIPAEKPTSLLSHLPRPPAKTHQLFLTTLASPLTFGHSPTPYPNSTTPLQNAKPRTMLLIG